MARANQFDNERIRPPAVASDPRVDQRTVPKKKGEQTCSMCGDIGHNRNNRKCTMFPLYQAFRSEAKANKEAGLPLQSVQQVIQLPANQRRIEDSYTVSKEVLYYRI